MYRNNLNSGVALATLMALSAAPALAQQQTTNALNVALETINVDGAKTKGAQRGDGEPATATEEQTVLTERSDRADLEQRSVADPKDIGRLAPGVSYSETTRGFNVRGLDRQRVSTTIDGIPLPYLDDGARGAGSPGATGGPGSVDFDSLSAIDIVKGSDSSVFGSGMLGGGVRFRTLEPEDLIDEGEKFGGLTKFAFDERDQSFRGEQALAGRVDNTFVLVQGGYRDGEELENKGTFVGAPFGTGRTIKNESDYDQENLLVKLRHYTDNGHMIGITGERFSRDEDITPLNLSATTYDLATVNTNETNRRDRISFDYKYDGGGLLDLAEAKVFWQRQELHDNFTATRRTTPIGDYRRDNMREYDIFGVNGSALKSIETEDAQHNVSFGGQVYGSKSHQFSLGEDNCPAVPPTPFHTCNFLHSNQSDMPDTDGIAVAAFVQDEIELFDNTVRVTPGVRFDYYSYTPELTPEYAESPAFSVNGLPDDNSDSAFSPKLRFEVDATDNVTLFAQWAQAFRAPTVNELYLTYGGPNTYLRIGDDELKPETSNGFDLGILTGDDRSGGSAKVFYNRYKNYIDDKGLDTDDPAVQAYLASLGYDYSDFPQGITQTINRANVQIWGAEFEAHHKLDNGLYGWGQLGAYYGEDMDLGHGLNTIPAAKLVVAVGYATDFWGVETAVTAVASRDYHELDGSEHPDATAGDGSDVESRVNATAAYELVDFTAWWSPKQVEGLTIRAGIYNIFDQSYFEDGLDLSSTATNRQYFTQPGRNFRASAVYKF